MSPGAPRAGVSLGWTGVRVEGLRQGYVNLLLQLGKLTLREKKDTHLGSSEGQQFPNLGRVDNRQNWRLCEGKEFADVHTGAPS